MKSTQHSCSKVQQTYNRRKKWQKKLRKQYPLKMGIAHKYTTKTTSSVAFKLNIMAWSQIRQQFWFCNTISELKSTEIPKMSILLFNRNRNNYIKTLSLHYDYFTQAMKIIQRCLSSGQHESLKDVTRWHVGIWSGEQYHHRMRFFLCSCRTTQHTFTSKLLHMQQTVHIFVTVVYSFNTSLNITCTLCKDMAYCQRCSGSLVCLLKM